MTTLDLYCTDEGHAAREGEDGWTSAPVATVAFEGDVPEGAAARYLSLCTACARAREEVG